MCMQIMWGRHRKFGDSICPSILFFGDLLNAKIAESGDKIFHFLEILHAFLPCLTFIQHMVDNKLQVAVGLRILYPWFFGYRKVDDQGLIFSFVVGGKKPKVEGILGILPFRVGKDKSCS